MNVLVGLPCLWTLPITLQSKTLLAELQLDVKKEKCILGFKVTWVYFQRNNVHANVQGREKRSQRGPFDRPIAVTTNVKSFLMDALNNRTSNAIYIWRHEELRSLSFFFQVTPGMRIGLNHAWLTASQTRCTMSAQRNEKDTSTGLALN